MNVKLLVSVRSASESESALHGRADLIDVKEPLRGPLGRAEETVLGDVVQAVAGKCPVSAALGELQDRPDTPRLAPELSFVKWGLSGCAGTGWKRELRERARSLPRGPVGVIVAYADPEHAGSPAVEEVASFACQMPWPGSVLLIDTFDKRPFPGERRKRTLLDWLDLDRLQELCRHCHACGVRLALAGSLGLEHVRLLVPLRPDWIGVRGAACTSGDRLEQISEERVRALAALLRPSQEESVEGSARRATTTTTSG
jgi:uncharacterized protein (UPF0264 family)